MCSRNVMKSSCSMPYVLIGSSSMVCRLPPSHSSIMMTLRRVDIWESVLESVFTKVNTINSIQFNFISTINFGTSRTRFLIYCLITWHYYLNVSSINRVAIISTLPNNMVFSILTTLFIRGMLLVEHRQFMVKVKKQKKRWTVLFSFFLSNSGLSRWWHKKRLQSKSKRIICFCPTRMVCQVNVLLQSIKLTATEARFVNEALCVSFRFVLPCVVYA